ncbi:ATP-binding cassette domain-containing protein [Actinomadura fulvescens]|uniref:High-affinity branched-chain amino acid ABC transporter ATP-binding protein LivG n=1 Tax=Actinomadura fulvescens TaxID=46160 RepID=A0ABN3PNR6_9ACTN
MPNDEGLRATGVTVRLGGLTAVDGVGLEAPPGTVTGLVGTGGAGKTTLLDVITGLRRPAVGTVHLDGADLTSCAAHERARHGMARTFQRPEAFGSLTVQENVLVAAELHTARQRRRRDARRSAAILADSLLERVGITAYAGRRAGTVPMGVARLMELARALAAEPRLLLLDEPWAGLPVPTARSLECLLRDLAAEGLAVLFTENDLDLVMGVCDVLYVLDAGKVISHGPPARVRSDPRVRRLRPGRAERLS